MNASSDWTEQISKYLKANNTKDFLKGLKKIEKIKLGPQEIEFTILPLLQDPDDTIRKAVIQILKQQDPVSQHTISSLNIQFIRETKPDIAVAIQNTLDVLQKRWEEQSLHTKAKVLKYFFQINSAVEEYIRNINRTKLTYSEWVDLAQQSRMKLPNERNHIEAWVVSTHENMSVAINLFEQQIKTLPFDNGNDFLAFLKNIQIVRNNQITQGIQPNQSVTTIIQDAYLHLSY